MSTSFSQHSAKILEFPRKGARDAARLRRTDQIEAEARLARVEFGSGWYHEAALADAQRVRKP